MLENSRMVSVCRVCVTTHEPSFALFGSNPTSSLLSCLRASICLNKWYVMSESIWNRCCKSISIQFTLFHQGFILSQVPSVFENVSITRLAPIIWNGCHHTQHFLHWLCRMWIYKHLKRRAAYFNIFLLAIRSHLRASLQPQWRELDRPPLLTCL